jgi:hypothetical protein
MPHLPGNGTDASMPLSSRRYREEHDRDLEFTPAHVMLRRTNIAPRCFTRASDRPDLLFDCSGLRQGMRLSSQTVAA